MSSLRWIVPIVPLAETSIDPTGQSVMASPAFRLSVRHVEAQLAHGASLGRCEEQPASGVRCHVLGRAWHGRLGSGWQHLGGEHWTGGQELVLIYLVSPLLTVDLLFGPDNSTSILLSLHCLASHISCAVDQHVSQAPVHPRPC